MATTMIRQRSEATPATWQRMLRKALDEGIAVRQLAGCGAWTATSDTDPNGAHLVSLSGCECPGHESGNAGENGASGDAIGSHGTGSRRPRARRAKSRCGSGPVRKRPAVRGARARPLTRT